MKTGRVRPVPIVGDYLSKLRAFYAAEKPF